MQPISGYNWTIVSGTAAGTTVVSSAGARLHAVIIPSTKTGTVTIYDDSAGATGNSIEVVNDTVVFPTALPLDFSMRYGIAAVKGGTTSMVVVWS